MLYNLQQYVDIARERVLSDLLPDVCSIYTRTRVNDGSGHYDIAEVITEYNSSTSIPCRIDPTKQYRDQDVLDQELNVTDYYFSLPFDVTIGVDDIIVHNTLRYQIKKLSDNHSWKAVKRAFVIVLR